jgi:hypothetical protein
MPLPVGLSLRRVPLLLVSLGRHVVLIHHAMNPMMASPGLEVNR